MQPGKSFVSKARSQRKARQQRGVALITALMLLLIMSGLSIVMVLSTNSDMMTNGYYRGFRGSFYAADSGVNTARVALINQLVAGVNGGYSTSTPAYTNSTTTASAAQTYMLTTYGSTTALTGTGMGQAANSYPESFKVTAATVSAPSCTTIGGNVGSTCAAPSWQSGLSAYGWEYSFPYSITTQGAAQSSTGSTITDTGNIVIDATLSAAGTKTSFAAWGMFINNYSICSSTLVPGTITGPVFTNGSWTFGNSGKYIFTDAVGSAGSKAGYSNGSCTQSTAASANGISPTFQKGNSWGQASVPLPTDDYNQEQAVLDGKGTASGAPTNAQLHASLMNASKTAYPSAGAASGVYLPYQIVAGVPTFTGGGIYIQGNASVKLSTSGSCTKNANGTCAAGGSYSQIYSITQGGTTTTVTVNLGTNTTTMVTGGNSVVISGVPEEYDPATGALIGPATMLYDNGNITGLSGPSQGVAAIQDGNALTVTANGDITVTGDILYKTEPVTLTQNQIPGQPADTLIPNSNNGQSLGIFTANGNVNMSNTQANGNLEIDASIATLCASGGGCTASSSGGLVNTGASINTLNIVGGRIQNNIMNIGATTRNVYFDRRYAAGGFSPPWFPSTTVGAGTLVPSGVTYVANRVQWVNQSAYF